MSISFFFLVVLVLLFAEPALARLCAKGNLTEHELEGKHLCCSSSSVFLCCEECNKAWDEWTMDHCCLENIVKNDRECSSDEDTGCTVSPTASAEALGLIKYPGFDSFPSFDAAQASFMSLTKAKALSEARGYGGFVVWHGNVYYRAQSSAELVRNKVQAKYPNTSLFVNDPSSDAGSTETKLMREPYYDSYSGNAGNITASFHGTEVGPADASTHHKRGTSRQAELVRANTELIGDVKELIGDIKELVAIDGVREIDNSNVHVLLKSMSTAIPHGNGRGPRHNAQEELLIANAELIREVEESIRDVKELIRRFSSKLIDDQSQPRSFETFAIYSYNFGNFRNELKSHHLSKEMKRVAKFGVPCFFFTDVRWFKAPNGWTTIYLSDDSSEEGLTATRVTIKRLKFKGHTSLKPYRFWIHVDGNKRRMGMLFEMLKNGLLEYVPSRPQSSLFVVPHPRRKTIEQEMVEIIRKKVIDSKEWEKWNAFLTPMYPELNRIRLPELAVFVIDSWNRRILQKWREIDDVILEHGITRDQVVFSYVMREENTTENTSSIHYFDTATLLGENSKYNTLHHRI